MRPRLVYLPGIDGTGRLLHRQPRLFAAYEVRCVKYPQDKPQTYEELADAAAAQLREGGCVLAESFGGAVALTLAMRYPHLVHRLILVNTFAWYPRQPLIRLLALFGRFAPNRPASKHGRNIRGRIVFGARVPADERQAWWDLTADVPLRAYGRRLRMIAGLDLRSYLSAIRVPAIVFVSTDDRVVPPCAGRLLASRLPLAKLITRRAGHAALIDPCVDIADMLKE